MEILDRTIPTDWAHDAVARATQALEPLADPIKNSSLLQNSLLGHKPSTVGRIRGVVAAHPYAVGMTVVALGALAFMAMRGGANETTDHAASGPQRVRSAA